MVADLNRVARAEAGLHRHLFGFDRVVPPKILREGMTALQGGRCFYCRGSLSAASQADRRLGMAEYLIGCRLGYEPGEPSANAHLTRTER